MNSAYHRLLANGLWWLHNFDEAVLSFEEAIRTASETLGVSSIEALSHNIICDHCEIYPILGIRFKCEIYADYDVCSGCIAKASEKHDSTHEFRRIPGSKWQG